MALAVVGIVLWILLAATAWKHAKIWPTLHRSDRIGAAVFFVVVGLPAFLVGLALIAQPLVA